MNFGQGVYQKHAVKIGFIFLILGAIGFVLECVSAMEYYQGKDFTIRVKNVLKNSKSIKKNHWKSMYLRLYFLIRKSLKGIRLALITSETSITILFFFLCACKCKFLIKNWITDNIVQVTSFQCYEWLTF